FGNLSQDATAYRWAFGDGVTSTLPSPTHTFAAPGDYTVHLTGTNSCGQDVTSATVTVAGAALAISQRSTPPVAEAGLPLTYTVAVSNVGDCEAVALPVYDRLPDGVTFVTATRPFTGPRAGLITWTVETLPIGAVRRFTLTVWVDSGLLPGTLITNTAAVAGPHDTPPATLAVPVTAHADLSIALDDQPDPVLRYAPLTYTLTYTNRGPADGRDIAITLTLPLSLSLGGVIVSPPGTMTVDGPRLAWRLPSLPARSGGQAVLTATVHAALYSNITGTAAIAGQPDDPHPDDNRAVETTTVITTPIITIWGTVFQDANGNGRRDATEPGLPDVTVSLSHLVTATTDSTGRYLFTTTVDGPYTVIETDPTAYVPGERSPQDVYVYFSTTANRVHVDALRGHTYRVDFGEAASGVGFAAIYGTVFADRDGDGQQDADEPGLAGVLVSSTEGTATTDVYGRYTLSTTVIGIGGAAETDPPGYFSTTPNTVHLAVSVGHGYAVDFGDAPEGADFATVYGTVFEDLNDNQLYDWDEVGLSGVALTLGTGSAALVLTTDSWGGYAFSTTANRVHVDALRGHTYRVDFGEA
ncbi:MAG TPA: DUF11 domain-containing protein, partial [Anaerolineae bacterium]|nr:DUF11 domain-containing protein [Anaerolineae bacterium]